MLNLQTLIITFSFFSLISLIVASYFKKNFKGIKETQTPSWLSAMDKGLAPWAWDIRGDFSSNISVHDRKLEWKVEAFLKNGSNWLQRNFTITMLLPLNKDFNAKKLADKFLNFANIQNSKVAIEANFSLKNYSERADLLQDLAKIVVMQNSALLQRAILAMANNTEFTYQVTNRLDEKFCAHQREDSLQFDGSNGKTMWERRWRNFRYGEMPKLFDVTAKTSLEVKQKTQTAAVANKKVVNKKKAKPAKVVNTTKAGVAYVQGHFI